MNNLIFVRNILHSSFSIGQDTTEALEFMTEHGNLSIEYVNGDINVSIRPDSFIHTSLAGHAFSFLYIVFSRSLKRALRYLSYSAHHLQKQSCK